MSGTGITKNYYGLNFKKAKKKENISKDKKFINSKSKKFKFAYTEIIKSR